MFEKEAEEKRCKNCVHYEEHKKAIREGKQGSAFCMLECNGSHSAFEEQELKMFEKEAREYRTHFENELYLFDNIDIFPKDIEEAYQKGAEFGYKQANEWHYIKDEKYPKDDNDVLVLLKDETMQVDYYFPKIGWNLSLKADVIAWKEIVLPKESE